MKEEVEPVSSKPMILDEQLPLFDVVIAEHLVVGADPETTWRAARELDFLSVHTPLMDASMWVRGLPARLRGQQPPPPAQLRLSGDGGLPGWLSLGEREGSEIAFGAVGVFWQPSISWRDVPLADFAGFAEPGYGKIACNFTVRDYGAGRSLLSYECRVAITDAVSRRKFARYWWAIRPFVAHIMRATLAAIGTDAHRRAASPASPAKPAPVS
jgi:hypothetical protein